MTFSATAAERKIGASIGINLPDEAPKDAKPRADYARDLQKIRDYVERVNTAPAGQRRTAEEIAAKMY